MGSRKLEQRVPQALHFGKVDQQATEQTIEGKSEFSYPAGRPLSLRGEQLPTDGPECRTEGNSRAATPRPLRPLSPAGVQRDGFAEARAVARLLTPVLQCVGAKKTPTG